MGSEKVKDEEEDDNAKEKQKFEGLRDGYHRILQQSMPRQLDNKPRLEEMMQQR